MTLCQFVSTVVSRLIFYRNYENLERNSLLHPVCWRSLIDSTFLRVFVRCSRGSAPVAIVVQTYTRRGVKGQGGEKASVEAFTRIQIDPFCRCCCVSRPGRQLACPVWLLATEKPACGTRVRGGLSRFVETISRLSRNKDMNA